MLPGQPDSQHAWSGLLQSASVSHVDTGGSGQLGGGGGGSLHVPYRPGKRSRHHQYIYILHILSNIQKYRIILSYQRIQ